MLMFPYFFMDDKELLKATKKFLFDPLGHVYFAYPWGDGSLTNYDGPDFWQADILNLIGNETKRRLTENLGAVQIAVASGHGIGKTALIAWIIKWFISTRPNPQIVVTANTKDQLQTKTWRELAKWHNISLYRSWFKWTATKFYAVWEPETHFANAIPWSKERSEAFAGTHEEYVLFLYDEASIIDDSIWEVTEGAMTTPGAMWIAFGNPTRNYGRFKECFVGGKYAHRWITHQIDSRTAKMANKKMLDQWIEDYGDDSDFVRVRVKGQFPRSSVFQLISEELVQNAMGKHIGEEDYRLAPKVIGVDVARFGDDSSVITRRQGLACIDQMVYPDIDNMTLAANVAQVASNWKADAIFIDAGRGEGVIDRLRQLRFKNVFEINFGGKATDEKHYHNKRSEMWDDTKKWLESGGSIPNDQDLKTELTAAEYAFDNRDRIQLERKEDIKAKMPLGNSPDKADSLALTFAMPVTTLHDINNVGHLRHADKRRNDYDPLGRNRR